MAEAGVGFEGIDTDLHHGLVGRAVGDLVGEAIRHK
jgi:hypothetical protein